MVAPDSDKDRGAVYESETMRPRAGCHRSENRRCIGPERYPRVSAATILTSPVCCGS